MSARVGPRGWQIWLAFFLYSAAIAWLVQLVILPYFMPHLDAGHGLMVGLDSTTYHLLAAEQAQRIRAEGWSAFRLMPPGGYLVGIASAIYAVTTPEPWVLVPVNSVMHASAAFLLFLIVERLVGRRWIAICATLPFLMYPSALSWFAQWHRDTWFILGNLLFLYGWLDLARAERWPAHRFAPLRAVAAISLGAFLAWLSRPYAAFMMQFLAILSALMLTALYVVRLRHSRRDWARPVLAVTICWLVVLGLGRLAHGNFADDWTPPAPPPSAAIQAVPPAGSAASSAAIQAVPPAGSAASSAAKGGALKGPALAVPTLNPPEVAPAVWIRADWLPTSLNRRFYSVSHWRDRFRHDYTTAGTNIDMGVHFQSPEDVIAYTPRAMFIGLFAPFPDVWTGIGKTRPGTLMRRVVAFEMIGDYLALAFVPYLFWICIRRIEVYLVFLNCLASTLVFSLVVTNVGALYRFRYCFMMTLVGLGVAGACMAFERFQRRTATAASSAVV